MTLRGTWRWQLQAGDPRSYLSGANAVYSYYAGRTARHEFTPGGIRDYEIPVVDSGTGSVAGPSAAVAAGTVISEVVDTGHEDVANPGLEEAFEPGGVFEDRPEGWVIDGVPWDPYAIPEEEPVAITLEDTTPPAFIPVTAGEEIPGDVGSLPEQTEEEDEPMSSFWDIASGVVDVIQGQPVGGQPVGFAPPVATGTNAPVLRTPTGGQSNLRYNPATGRWECKRRRRRRLLTESDFNDLMRIATLPNKQNVTVALAKAIGRRS